MKAIFRTTLTLLAMLSVNTVYAQNESDWTEIQPGQGKVRYVKLDSIPGPLNMGICMKAASSAEVVFFYNRPSPNGSTHLISGGKHGVKNNFFGYEGNAESYYVLYTTGVIYVKRMSGDECGDIPGSGWDTSPPDPRSDLGDDPPFEGNTENQPD